ncbi:MAG: TetR/AcrR family transcriptional regulator [Cellulosilyticaceae bacterium]
MARNKFPEITIERILDASQKLFFEKGYDDTTIQDIIDALGDLSKGAIYHHFKSKEEIMKALTTRMASSVADAYAHIITNKDLNGLEKIKELLYINLQDTVQEDILDIMPNMLKNPKLLVMQLEVTMNGVAHEILESMIRVGIEDGSIKTDYPRELAEVIALLLNIWLNPYIFDSTGEESYKKCMFIKTMTDSLGVAIIDNRILDRLNQLMMQYKK